MAWFGHALAIFSLLGSQMFITTMSLFSLGTTDVKQFRDNFLLFKPDLELFAFWALLCENVALCS